jgi:hypothetical protein
MQFKRRTLARLADMICGNSPDGEGFFVYRSSYLTEFFADAETDYAHDGATRQWWVVDVLTKILDEPQQATNIPPETFARVIDRLMDQDDARNEGEHRPGALAQLNAELVREGYEAFYGDDRKCYLKHLPTNTVAAPDHVHGPRRHPRPVRGHEPSASRRTRMGRPAVLDHVNGALAY